MKPTLSRRLLPMATGMVTLTLVAPGSALAHGRHHGHHHKTGRGHHARVSFEHFGPIAASTTGPAGTPSTTGPAGTPSTGTTSTQPSTPTSPTNENAGKVASYTGGVLTLTLADGSRVSGKVTASTKIECISATPPPTSDQDDEEGAPGDDNGPGDDQSEGDGNQGGGSPDAQQPQAADQSPGGDDENGAGDDQDDGGPISSEPPCDTSALVEGAIVRSAELRIAPGGNEFESLELVR